MSFEVGELTCSVTVEQLAPSGEILKKVIHKNAVLLLGRNEFGEMLLKIDVGKKQLKFMLKEINVHKRFAKDGKATIKINNSNTQLMLSNCPPDKLILFLKTLSTKLTCLHLKGFTNERKKLLSELPRTFQQISPLNTTELETVHNMRAKAVEQQTDLFTPKGKRKRVTDMDKENRAPKSIKTERMQLLASNKPRQILNPVALSKEQTKVLTAVIGGRNIFFTGSAGTGKSFLLRRIIGALPPQHTFATASTGVAACHIGGTTLHAFAGIGSGQAPLEQCVELASRPLIIQQWRKCRHLIVDEISMVDGELFDKLEKVARIVKKNDQPFGGIQLILCGDFLQLPPVSKGNERKKFAFQSRAWGRCIEVNLELTEVRRQSDKKFINVLQNIRLGRCPTEVSQVLQATLRHTIEKDGIVATRLCTHKEDVDHINEVYLNKLTGQVHTFEAGDSDPSLVRLMDKHCPVTRKLELRPGAQVMLAKNLDIQRGLVNGARGVVVDFENDLQGCPRVKFVCGETVTVRHERWGFKAPGGVHLTRRQLPLKLAWAISIHKSQGMSLDCVEISLSRVFENGQAYVALSRARSLDGLRVLDFSPTCVRAHPDVVKFYRTLRLGGHLQQTTLDNFV